MIACLYALDVRETAGHPLAGREGDISLSVCRKKTQGLCDHSKHMRMSMDSFKAAYIVQIMYSLVQAHTFSACMRPCLLCTLWLIREYTDVTTCQDLCDRSEHIYSSA